MQTQFAVSVVNRNTSEATIVVATVYQPEGLIRGRAQARTVSCEGFNRGRIVAKSDEAAVKTFFRHRGYTAETMGLI